MAATQKTSVAMGRTELRLAKTAAEDEGQPLGVRDARGARPSRGT